MQLPASPASPVTPPWWKELNRYHWFVLTVACLGWMFDCLDQQLFNLARAPAMASLLHGENGAPPTPEKIAEFGGYATSVFLIGWAIGGLVFGVLGDRIGRARTMMLTILLYSVFTGLSSLSRGFWDFALYRLLTGLGVGGEFAVGVALVAEVMPERARPYALGLLQALSAVGNVTAALVSMALGHLQQTGTVAESWRWMFVAGALPALLVLVVRARLREPERWVQARARAAASATRLPGPYSQLFGNPRWRHHAIVGTLLACAGVIGLWGIGFFSIDLQRLVFHKHFAAQGLSAPEIAGKLTFWAGITSMMLNAGAVLGMLGFSALTQRIGRRPAFAIALIASFITTAAVFLFLDAFYHLFILIPLMGMAQLSLFAGYAIYFPELFPTTLRSTGISLCYNVGRFFAASGPLVLGLLTSRVFSAANGFDEGMRYAGLVMCSIFLLGLLVLPFAPETSRLGLPEEDPEPSPETPR